MSHAKITFTNSEVLATEKTMWEQTEDRNRESVGLSGTVFKQRKSKAVRNGLLFGRGIILEQIEIALWQRQVVASPCHPV